MIQSEEWLAEQTRQTEWHPISRPLVDDLIVVYAIDAPYLRMYLNHPSCLWRDESAFWHERRGCASAIP